MMMGVPAVVHVHEGDRLVQEQMVQLYATRKADIV